jgi:Transmembrane secretion effector
MGRQDPRVIRLRGDRRTSSTWTALGNPTFRNLWIATIISGTCVGAHDTAATWVMNTLTPSPFLISLLSTVASLPFFCSRFPPGLLPTWWTERNCSTW